MLLVGSDDGVYRVPDALEPETRTERVLSSGRVFRTRALDGAAGVFAATETGLFHSLDGREWTDLGVPREQVYAIGATPGGDRLFAGTRPAEVYVANANTVGEPAWRALDGFRDLPSSAEWGLARHGNRAQVRSLRVPAATPDRIVAGVEVGGVFVSDDGGETWTDRRIEGFDAPHTDDIHHLALEDSETMVAATGSGLYRTTDAGRTWTRLDTDHRQTYFREVFVDEDVRFAGGSPTPPASWEDDPAHALFACHDGRTLETVPSPTPEEVAVGWCATDEDLLAATNRGTLLARRSGGWERVGSVPVPERAHGRCIPLSWYVPRESD